MTPSRPGGKVRAWRKDKKVSRRKNSRSGGRTRTGLFGPQDFKSCASAYFAIRPRELGVLGVVVAKVSEASQCT